MKNYDEAKYHLHDAREISNNFDKNQVGDMLFHIGSCFHMKHDSLKAYQNYKDSLLK